MVAVFLHILAHDVKNRVVQREFLRSGKTISWHFNIVLLAVVHFHDVLLKKPQSVSTVAQIPDGDGTHIKVNMMASDRPRYRTRKGEVATNVLGVCDMKVAFVFVLAGWEGSAVDSHILRDAISRLNSLKSITTYSIGYPNAEDFLAPYKGQRYHLQEWPRAKNAPSIAKEFFNMKHSPTHNVIERAFRMLKGRWKILRGKSYYPVQVQCLTILACCLLQNLINKEMMNADISKDIDEGDSTYATTIGDDIHYIETSNKWGQWKDDLAKEIFSEWGLRN
ncbi:putative nuclease HARBI1 [Cucumis melo var. makuwa]|uniref:Putative nuclease HARBI1 n=1 Tax=Cucumis melo var. makuwa TaxID=1194695 RepID=A0A5D3BLS5_CUCMM|nr:putative nuclease HARBI1 [Cucumis melo var. makuwa]